MKNKKTQIKTIILKNDIDINKNNSSKINLKCTQNFEKSKQNSFKIMYSNVDTLSNKLNEVEYYSEIYETDLILITEHLPKNSLDKFENVFNIPAVLKTAPGEEYVYFIRMILKL